MQLKLVLCEFEQSQALPLSYLTSCWLAHTRPFGACCADLCTDAGAPANVLANDLTSVHV